MSEPSVRATAHHEAGHAVAAIKLRIGISEIVLNPRAHADLLGFLQYRTQLADPQRAQSYTGPLETAADWKAMAVFERMAELRRCKAVQATRRRMIVALAGPAAEGIFTGTDRLAALESESDRDVVATLVFSLAGTEAEANELIEALQLEAFAMMTEFWPAVERLALELEKKGRISGREARQIVRG